MAGYADLEIGLHRRGTGGYSAEVRFSQPGSDADVRLTSGAPALARELTGDTQGAIEDFCFFVDHSTNDAAIGQCQAWIAALEAGQNPFDQATLDALRNE